MKQTNTKNSNYPAPADLEMLRRFIRSQIANPDDAADAFQETLLIAQRKSADVYDKQRWYFWARAIAININKQYYARKRWRSWSDMYEELQASSETSQRRLLDVFDSMFDVLKSMKMEYAVAGMNALHYCLDWTPKQIAKNLCIHVSKVYRGIQSVKQAGKRKRGGRKFEVTALKTMVAASLMNAGNVALEGGRYRNMQLVSEGYHLLRITQMEHPNNSVIQLSLLKAVCMMLVNSAYTNDNDPPAFERDWNKCHWNQSLREEGLRQYQVLVALSPDEPMKLEAEFYTKMFLSTTAEEDWKGLLAVSQRLVVLKPSRVYYYGVAHCLDQLYGSASAAQYIEELKNNMHLKDASSTYGRMGMYYYLAGNWKKSGSYIRKYLRWPLNSATAELFRDWLRVCSLNLKHRSQNVLERDMA